MKNCDWKGSGNYKVNSQEERCCGWSGCSGSHPWSRGRPGTGMGSAASVSSASSFYFAVDVAVDVVLMLPLRGETCSLSTLVEDEHR
jgi:hypothetical protein